jgi:hypothetical protein
MEIDLINGQFSSKEAIDLIGEMIQVKIKYHENKIKDSHNEEDVKMRESKIKTLQNELAKFRAHINTQEGTIFINGTIKL